MNRRVLIIAHLYRASPRIPGLSRYLSSHGWESVILTPPVATWAGSLNEPARDLTRYTRLVETARYETRKSFDGQAYRAVRARAARGNVLWQIDRIVSTIYRFLRSLYLELRWYPDSDKEWIPRVVTSARELLSTEHYDALISTSSPVSAHLAAMRVSAEHGIPWVADLRDLWTQNHNYSFSPLRRWFERRLEKRTLSRAAALVTISDEWVAQLQTLHRTVPGYSIKNGFEPSFYRSSCVLTDRFTITYTGQIYAAQDPEMLFRAILELAAEGVIDRHRVVVRFFGPMHSLLVRYAEHFDLEGMIELHDIVPWEAVARLQMESHLLLLLNWGTTRGSGWYPLKLFEYLGARRPVIAVGGRGDDVVDRLLARTRVGVYCATHAEVKAAVAAFYRQYEISGYVKYDGLESAIAPFSYPKLAHDYARVLDRAVDPIGAEPRDCSGGSPVPL